MARLRRTLLIGVGGTGIKTILDAKKMFYENYGEIPPMIGFVGIDTDRPGLGNSFVIANDGTRISLNTSEQLCISVDDPILIYQRYKNDSGNQRVFLTSTSSKASMRSPSWMSL